MSERFRAYDSLRDCFGPPRDSLAEAEADAAPRLREYSRDHVDASKYLYVVRDICTCKKGVIASWLGLRDPTCPACRGVPNAAPALRLWRWVNRDWLRLDYWIYLE